MTALLAVPLVAMMGLAIDLSRVWLVRSRLQVSLDAAVLVAARDISTGGTSADGVNMFWTNFNRTSKTIRSGGYPGYQGATATDPKVFIPAPGDVSGSVQMTSTATVVPTLLGVLNIGVVTVGAASTAKTAATGLELAMVLDNTGSMAGSSITALITASQTLLDILYGTASDTQPNLWVSVVPFAATINIKNTYTGWLVSGSLDQSKYAPSSWMGCVMARTAKTGAQAGDDFNDKTPTQAPLTPFLYPSTYHIYPTPAGIQYTDSKGKKQVYWYPGDNDWTASPNNIIEPDDSNHAGNNTVGPNLDCPSLPILPETASKATILATINKMVPVDRGGTFINLGLQAGWWTISPNWIGLWGGNLNMPLAYNTPYMRKAIILMTDGNNEWYDWPDGVPGQTPPTAPPTGVPAWTADGDADFTAYGRLKSNTLGIVATQATITTTLNTWMLQMCTTIKQNGIVIYTVLFNNTAPATIALFTSCASSPADYFQSPSVVPLQQAFQQIGKDLSSLRISQ
jgi:Flp pilus assembly protein TadG